MRKPWIGLLLCGLAVAACSSGGTSNAVESPGPTVSSTATSSPTDTSTEEAIYLTPASSASIAGRNFSIERLLIDGEEQLLHSLVGGEAPSLEFGDDAFTMTIPCHPASGTYVVEAGHLVTSGMSVGGSHDCTREADMQEELLVRLIANDPAIEESDGILVLRGARATVEAREGSPLTSGSPLRLDGIGPVRIGMTTTEASRASGKSIRVDPASSPHPSSCAFATIEGMSHIAFMVISERIQRVDVGPESSVRTVSGVGIGDSDDEVQRIYGDRTRVEPHPYDEEGRYLVYDSPEPSQRGLLLIFETDGTRVTSFRAGERGAVEAPEGCA